MYNFDKAISRLHEYCNSHNGPPVGLIEADSFSQLALWRQYKDDPDGKMDTARSGIGLTIGELDSMPIHVSYFMGTLRSKPVLFWEATSQVVDHRMIEQFHRAAYPNANHVDAINASNAIREG